MADFSQLESGDYVATNTPPGTGAQKWDDNFRRNAEGRMGVVNAKAFGAKGNGSDDDTDAIIDALEAVQSDGALSLFLPRGEYKISDTIPHELLEGAGIRGVGPRQGLGTNGTQTYNTTHIVASSGAAFASKPMISLYRTSQVVLEGFSMDGDPSASGTKASVGIRQSSVNGYGSNRLFTRQVVVHRCQIGMRFGDGVTHTNDSESTHIGLGFKNCGQGVHFSNNQNVNHDFYSCEMHTCDYGWYLGKDNPVGNAAAAIRVYGVNSTSVPVLFYAADGNSNGGCNIVQGVRLETSAIRTQLLVMASSVSGGSSRWRFSDITDKYPNISGSARFVLHNGARVTIHDTHQLAEPGPLCHLNGNAYVHIYGNDLPDVLSQIISQSGGRSEGRYLIHHNHANGVNHTGGSGGEWKQ